MGRSDVSSHPTPPAELCNGFPGPPWAGTCCPAEEAGPGGWGCVYRQARHQDGRSYPGVFGLEFPGLSSQRCMPASHPEYTPVILASPLRVVTALARPSGWGWVGGRWTKDVTGGGLLTHGAVSELRQGQWAGPALRSKHTQTFWMVPAASCQGLLTGGRQPALGLARLHCLSLKAGLCRPPKSSVCALC